MNNKEKLQICINGLQRIIDYYDYTEDPINSDVIAYTLYEIAKETLLEINNI